VLILATDDDEVVLQIIKEMVGETEHHILLARTGEDTLEKFAEEHGCVDVVLLDCILPLMSGCDAYRFIRRFNKDVGIIFTSGHDQAREVREAKQIVERDSRTAFLEKPIESEVGRVLEGTV